MSFMYIKLKWDVNFAQSKPFKGSTARIPADKEQLYKQRQGKKNKKNTLYQLLTTVAL